MAAHEEDQRRSCASRRVDGGVGYRDRDQVDEGQCKADGEAGGTDHAALVGRAEDNEQEHGGHHHFGDEPGRHGVLARRQVGVTVDRQSVDRQREARLPARDEVKQECGGDRSKNLCDDVRDKLAGGEASADHEPYRHRGVQMAAGDVADGIGHGQYRKAEGQRDTEQADTDIRKGRREHGAAAAAEDEPEGADEFGDEFVAEVHGLLLTVRETLKKLTASFQDCLSGALYKGYLLRTAAGTPGDPVCARLPAVFGCLLQSTSLAD